ncbi:MAG: Ig-like domain-containing protein [Eubacteriales bacterium]|nr:Ig-like domain-containing protein [Eubacteriales bacterium]
MKTSKSNVKCRFGRLLSGILSTAMLFTAAAFQIPVSADEETGGYEVLYDYMQDYTPESSLITKDEENGWIKAYADGDSCGNSLDFKAVLSEDAEQKTVGKTVRWHYDVKYDNASAIYFESFANANRNDDDRIYCALSQKSFVEGEDKIQKLVYGSGAMYDYGNQTAVTEPAKLSADTWYSVDVYYDLLNRTIKYYIDGSKVGETALNPSAGGTTIDSLVKFRMTMHEWTTGGGPYYGKANYYFKNAKIDIGAAAEIIDTDNTGATLTFTQPIDNLDSGDLSVKNLESGNSLDVTVDKVNDMKYKLNYDTGVNIGGDYMLTFSDAFAAINGIGEKTIVYSQKPTIADEVLYDYMTDYIPTSSLITKDEENGWIKVFMDGNQCGNSLDLTAVLAEAAEQKTIGRTVKWHYDVKYDSVEAIYFESFANANRNDDDRIYRALSQKTFADGEEQNQKLVYGSGTMYDYDNQTAVAEPVKLSADTWYAVDVYYDLSNRTIKYYIDGNKVGETALNPSAGGTTIDSLVKFRITMHEWTSGGGTYYGQANYYFKNAKITCNGTEMNGISSVQYSTDGISYSPAVDKVDCETKYVKIDFVSAMEASTLDNIKLMKGETAVGSTGAASNDNKTYTLTLTEKLATNTEYTLNIPTTVKTAGGNSLARAYAGKITTTAGVFRVDLLDIQKSGISVTEGDVAANDTINAIVKITNTEGRTGEAYLCICVYNDKVLKQLKFERIDLAKESEKSVPITVQSIDKIKIKAFLWNNFEAMKPLIPNKTVGE